MPEHLYILKKSWLIQEVPDGNFFILYRVMIGPSPFTSLLNRIIKGAQRICPECILLSLLCISIPEPVVMLPIFIRICFHVVWNSSKVRKRIFLIFLGLSIPLQAYGFSIL